MRVLFIAVPAFFSAGVAVAQDRPNVLEPRAPVPPIEYRSAFESYRPFTEQALANWRKANEEVAAAGGHAGQRPGQGPGQPSSKPQPGKPESSGDTGHGGHK